MGLFGSPGGNSQTYHVVKTVLGLLVAIVLVVLGLQDMQGRGWPLLLIAGVILLSSLLRWLIFREKP
jgi:hypothetical protein